MTPGYFPHTAQRFRTLFTLRNIGGEEAVAAIGAIFGTIEPFMHVFTHPVLSTLITYFSVPLCNDRCPLVSRTILIPGATVLNKLHV